MTEHMIPPESPFRAAGAGFSADAPAPTIPLPPHRAHLWDFPAVAMLGAHTYWRRPELTGIEHRSKTLRWWHRFLGAVLGALWGASMAWTGLVLLSPGRDVAVSIWLPWRWWRVVARMLAFLVVFFLAVLVPSVVLWLVFEVDVVPALAVPGVVITLVTVVLAWVDRRAHRGRGPIRLPGMVSITGLASRSRTAWGPTSFLHEELLPWVKDHNVGLYAPAASPVHARLYGGAGFLPAPGHGPLALIRPADSHGSHSSRGPTVGGHG